MRHVWLPSLGVWAQAQEPSVAEFAASTSTFCQSSESRADSASCSNGECSSTETRKHNSCRRHDHHDSPYDGHLHHHSHHNNHHDAHGGSSHGYNCCHRKTCEQCEQHDHRHRRLGVCGPHLEASDEHNQHEHHHDGCDGSHQYSRHHHRAFDEYHDHHHKDHHTCPICLSPISQSSLTVLRWCMHRFCLPCIEKWSCMERFCPLCKQIFHGWYYNIRSPSVFDKKDLAAGSSRQTSSQLRTRGRRERYPVPRQPTSLSVRSSRPLPWRQNFRFPRRTTLAHFEKVLESKADEEALQWRASVYKKNLRAVPHHVVNSRVKINEAPANDPERKARIERRLEPWIHRELRAIMDDSNPSLLVHLVLSLWLHALSEREKVPENRNSEHQRVGVLQTGLWDSEAIKQLEPFLQEKACVFWHELKCFAESPFSLRTYDSVTTYEKCRG